MATTDRSTYPPMLTLSEVSTALRVSTKTVRRMIDRHDLIAFRIGGQIRVNRDSVLELMRKGQM